MLCPYYPTKFFCELLRIHWLVLRNVTSLMAMYIVFLTILLGQAGGVVGEDGVIGIVVTFG